MTGFHEIRFPDNIAYGATGGPEFATTVVVTGAGHEQRNVNWARGARALGRRYRAQEPATVGSADSRSSGRGRAKPTASASRTGRTSRRTGLLLGTGDDATTEFQLIKRYPSGSAAETRSIAKPVAGTVAIYFDGVEQLSSWSVDVTTGIVTFTSPPAQDVDVSADFEFDVPVRFDTDHMAVTIDTYNLHRWQQIPIVELRA